MKRRRGCRQTGHADEYDNINFCRDFCTRFGSLFGNSKGCEGGRRNGGNGEHGPDLAAGRTGSRRRYGHEHRRLARRQGGVIPA